MKEQITNENNEITVSEFIERINKCGDEIGCDGENIASHKIKSSVTVRCENSDEDFELADIDISRLFGCGCWQGIVLVIKKIED